MARGVIGAFGGTGVRSNVVQRAALGRGRGAVRTEDGKAECVRKVVPAIARNAITSAVLAIDIAL